MNRQVFNLPRNKILRQELRNNATGPEQTLWRWLRGKQLGAKFRRQQGIGRYIVDFYCPEYRLVIELDGDSHYTEKAQVYDQLRDDYFKQLGMQVLRFTNEQVTQNIEGVYDAIRKSIAGRAILSRPPP